MNIVCLLKSGGDFSPRHVHTLQKMCQQWIRHKHEFVCLTDVPESLRCRTVRLESDAKGWWAKMELFRVFQGRTLYLDLDTIIRSPVDLGNIQDHPFIILRDFYRGAQNPKAMGSGVMWWSEDLRWIWQMWCERGHNTLRGDQDFLELAFDSCLNPNTPVAFFQDIAPEMVCSFKANIRGVKVPSQAPIVCFHGHPRPWDQKLIQYPLEIGRAHV